MPDLLQEIEAEIAGAKAAAAKRSVGVIREIGDGVARIEGLADVMLNETLDFGGGVMGLALSLEETDVAAIMLGDYTRLREGGEVTGTGTLLQVPVGPGSARPRGRHARGAARRQGPDRERHRVSRGEARAGNRPPASDRTAGADRHHGDRRDDPDRPRTTRADHRRSRHRQDDHLHRHDDQPGPPEQGGRSGRRSRIPAALLHLRGDRTEAIDDRAPRHRARRGRRDALQHHRRGAARPIPRPVSIWRRSRARRSANGSWITAWTR